MRPNRHEIENYSWGVLQDMIEKEISSAFKLKEVSTKPPTPTMPTKKEIKQIIKKTVIEQRNTKNNREREKKHERYRKELLECSEKGVEISQECKDYYKKQFETSENDERKENS